MLSAGANADALTASAANANVAAAATHTLRKLLVARSMQARNTTTNALASACTPAPDIRALATVVATTPPLWMNTTG